MVEYNLSGVLRVEADGPVTIVTFNRPDALNAFDDALHHAYARLWVAWSTTTGPGCRAHRCRQGLLRRRQHRRLHPAPRRPGRPRSMMRSARRLVDEMINVRVPVVAAVNGPAVGLGCTLATLCDIVFLADTARLADPHVAVALVAGDGGAVTWPHLTSLLKAKQYLLTGDRIPPRRRWLSGWPTSWSPPTRLLPRGARLRPAAGRPSAPSGTGHQVRAQPCSGGRPPGRWGSGWQRRPIPTTRGVPGGTRAVPEPEVAVHGVAVRSDRASGGAADLAGRAPRGRVSAPSRRGWPGRRLRLGDPAGLGTALAAARWLNVSWPEEYGGRGGTPRRSCLFHIEHAAARRALLGRRAGPRPVRAHAPTSSAPRSRSSVSCPPSPPVEEMWGQGFSEPDAGSDLAGLEDQGRARRRRMGDHRPEDLDHVRHHADWLYVLCRTDPTAPKHKGISMLLVPRHQAGVDVRPIRNIAGGTEFSEMFFDGARTRPDNVVGEVNGGWRVVMGTLGNERGGTTMLPFQALFRREMHESARPGPGQGPDRDPVVRQRLAAAWAGLRIMELNNDRLLGAVLRGEHPGPESSVGKLYWANWHRSFGEL